jgi:hypothetical protein
MSKKKKTRYGAIGAKQAHEKAERLNKSKEDVSKKKEQEKTGNKGTDKA